MSLKLDLFQITGVAAPKTIEKFWVYIPFAGQSLLKVSAATVPSSSYIEDSVWLFGRAFYLPVAKESTGTWDCVMEEDALLGTAMQLSLLQTQFNNYRARLHDISVAMTDQLTGEAPQLLITLKNAWLARVAPVQLDWSRPTDPVKWQLTFRYNGITRWY